MHGLDTPKTYSRSELFPTLTFLDLYHHATIIPLSRSLMVIRDDSSFDCIIIVLPTPSRIICV